MGMNGSLMGRLMGYQWVACENLAWVWGSEVNFEQIC